MTPLSWIKRKAVAACFAIAAALGITGGAAAAPITLTFDGLGLELYPESWSESGFIITSLSPEGGHLHAGGDELLLHSRNGSSPY